MSTTASIVLLAILSVAQLPVVEPTLSQLRKQINELAQKTNTKNPKVLAKRIDFAESELRDLEKRVIDIRANVKALQDKQAGDAAINMEKEKQRALEAMRDQRKGAVEQSKKDLIELKALRAKLVVWEAEWRIEESLRQWLRPLQQVLRG